MTADPNDGKGPQQEPATDAGKLARECAAPADTSAQLLASLANIWEEGSRHRSKGRPEELADIPPASMRHMATVLKIYARQLAAAGSTPAPAAVAVPAAAVEPDAVAAPAETVTLTVVDQGADVAPAPVPFVVEVTAETGPFGPPGAYVEHDDDAYEDGNAPTAPAFGPPGPYIEEGEGEGPKA